MYWCVSGVKAKLPKNEAANRAQCVESEGAQETQDT